VANKGTPAKQKYDAAYEARPEQVANRVKRNKARRDYEAKHGDLPSTVDVDHKRRLAKGGSNAAGNLRAVDQSKNRGWRGGKKGYDK
jgi:hypothetical protein